MADTSYPPPNIAPPSYAPSPVTAPVPTQPMPARPVTPSPPVYAPSPIDISRAILHHESGSTPTNLKNPTSPAGAVGPGQIMPATARPYTLPGEDLHNPADNLKIHQRIIDDYSRRWPNDPARVAVAYFSGPGNVAPPGSPTPWIRNSGDGNNTVAQYVANTAGKVGTSTTPATPAAKPSFAQAAQSGDIAAAVAALNTPNDQTSKSPMDNLGSMAGGGQQRQQAAAAAAPETTPDPTIAMHNANVAAQGPQRLQQAIADYTKPLTWGSGVPGTTLNTTGA